MESTILSSELLMESTILSSELLMESTHFKFQPPTYWESMGVYYCQPQLVNLNLVNTFGYIGVLDEFTRSLVKRYLWWYLVVLVLLVNLYLVNTFEYVGVPDEFTRSLVSKDLWWYLVDLVLVLVTVPAQLWSHSDQLACSLSWVWMDFETTLQLIQVDELISCASGLSKQFVCAEFEWTLKPLCNWYKWFCLTIAKLQYTVSYRKLL